MRRCITGSENRELSQVTQVVAIIWLPVPANAAPRYIFVAFQYTFHNETITVSTSCIVEYPKIWEIYKTQDCVPLHFRWNLERVLKYVWLNLPARARIWIFVLDINKINFHTVKFKEILYFCHQLPRNCDLLASYTLQFTRKCISCDFTNLTKTLVCVFRFCISSRSRHFAEYAYLSVVWTQLIDINCPIWFPDISRSRILVLTLNYVRQIEFRLIFVTPRNRVCSSLIVP